MRRWLKVAALGVALILLVLTFLNASWLAAAPTGEPKVIAHRGVYQQFSQENVGRDTCTATRIEPPVHDYQENTVRSMLAAATLGADMIEADIAPTADGKIALFHDWTIDCRTDGTGEVRDQTLAELKALDIAHGYTADGGRTFPFRGQRTDQIPETKEATATIGRTPFLFHFKSKNPAEADLLAAALKAAGRDVEKIGDAFYGAPGPVARIRKHYPNAWAWSLPAAKRCTKDYALYGWTSVVPESCRNGTIVIPLNYQWAFWGWPNRLIQRMDKVGARVLVTGPDADSGLNLPEQLGEVPSSFNGYIWVEDIWSLGPALRPDRDFRTREQQDAAEAALERRRKRLKEEADRA